ncbi:MAG: helix-turn-helix domain-containing protein [Methanomassiliicoccales archaeon]|uniref:ArsR/SmtB family transcription factor n=1 Tax=Candidatus Methanarcanum hacksteinii TaxID=2911857 RepID=UPI002A76C4DC|nr:helix-turn-helix domain-containing protein [Candidatus Methanomethylophilaceae archaeon]MCI6024312.1 helix-turn-helix domain-containing protein [Methanomassiliicoccales archaeon]MDD7479467.1 helix-turn-helix domain-containing protein [Methanomassiliicoccales archaeon]MDY4579971.1 helix-turn-helix domain-containing protein [Candidatus Methanarcanum hacksteinii]
MMDLDVLLSMIENPTRRKILESLVKMPRYPLQLSKELGISQQAVMKNLSVLEKNGMVVSYRESSSIGPERTVYEPNSEFTLIVDMRNGMFSARMVEPKGERKDVDVDNLKEMRSKVIDIDNELEQLEKRYSELMREKESIIASVISKQDGYAQKSLAYEILDAPKKTVEELSKDLNARTDVVKEMIDDIERRMKDNKEGEKDEQ